MKCSAFGDVSQRLFQTKAMKPILTLVTALLLASWIDCNAIFYGVYDSDEQAKQLAGQSVAMPETQ